MKLNKLMNIALTMGLTMGALTTGTALAQKKAEMVKADMNKTAVAMANFAPTADIEAKVEACEDAACTKLIPNGGSTVYSGGAPANYVRLSVKNKGAVKAENFVVSYAVRNNGTDVYKTTDLTKVTLEAGATKVFPVVKVQLQGTTNKVTGTLLANVMKFVPEENMSNNKATVAFTASVVH